MAQPLLGREVSPAPADGVTRVSFTPTSSDSLLLVTGWDCSLRLYDAVLDSMSASFKHPTPILDGQFLGSSSTIATGCLDGNVRTVDVTSGTQQVLGAHSEGVRCVLHAESRGLVLSGSWDQTVRAWDPRAGPSGAGAATLQVGGKVFAMSGAGDRVVVATSTRRILVYDVRSLSAPEQDRESPLKFQTRTVCCFPDGQGFAVGSVEGRVAMEYFDPSEESQAKKFAFKCHRRQENGKDVVYPVNSIVFHPVYGTFATGGCDGVVAVWDGEAKKRLYQFAKYPTSVASLAFNAAGTLMAVASSYTFEEGEKQAPPDAVYVRPISEPEVKGKRGAVVSGAATTTGAAGAAGQ